MLLPSVKTLSANSSLLTCKDANIASQNVNRKIIIIIKIISALNWVEIQRDPEQSSMHFGFIGLLGIEWIFCL